MRVPERDLDLQPLLGEDFAPSFTDKKRDIGTTLNQATAEIAANSPRTEHQDLGIAHSRSSSSDLRYPAAGATQANSIRVPPGSLTIKCTLGPLPDRSGANSMTVSGHAATRACKASSAARSTTLSARWCRPPSPSSRPTTALPPARRSSASAAADSRSKSGSYKTMRLTD